MGSPDPHVSVVVHDADETAQFLAVSRFGYVHDGFNLVSQGLDSAAGNPVAEIF